MALKAVLKEKCLWYSCETVKGAKYKIYNSTTTVNKPPYKASCSKTLCNITYDNNRITITLGGQGVKGCIFKEEFIKNDCPSISVTVPNDTFSVVDSINSECSNNSVKANRADITDLHPSWDIITENRICVLGYLVYDGNKNIDGPVYGVGGFMAVPCGSCNFICEGFGGIPGVDPIGNCGQSGADSRPWSAFIGSTRVNFPLATSANKGAKEALRTEWENNMRQIYANIAVCKSRIPEYISNLYPDRVYNVSDIVEGIVPDTCKFTIGSINYPAVFVKAPNAQVDGTVSVLVAYYSYNYRRPRTIQDILKDNAVQGSAAKCSERASQCNISVPKITSNYDTSTCADTPKCYDTSMNRCSSSDYCCQTNKTAYL